MRRRGRPRKITGKVITGKKITGKKISKKDIIDKKVSGKKRGRPPKVITDKVITGKRRGRPPKEITDNNIPDNSIPEKKVLTREEMEDRKEKIRATLPKFDPYRVPNIINLAKDSDACIEYTKFSCHRPDIYLDLGCSECILQKDCACPLKDVKRHPEDKRPKFRRFTSQSKKSS